MLHEKADSQLYCPHFIIDLSALDSSAPLLSAKRRTEPRANSCGGALAKRRTCTACASDLLRSSIAVQPARHLWQQYAAAAENAFPDLFYQLIARPHGTAACRVYGFLFSSPEHPGLSSAILYTHLHPACTWLSPEHMTLLNHKQAGRRHGTGSPQCTVTHLTLPR